MACWSTEEPPSRIEWDRADLGDFWFFLRDWLRRAGAAQQRLDRDPFPGLIYAWVSFNAWLGQTVADRELSQKDGQLVKVAAFDDRLTSAFERVTSRTSESASAARRLHQLLPVFKARALVDKGLEPWNPTGPAESREQYRATCFGAQLRRGDWAPRCFESHQANGTAPHQWTVERVPFDWLHLIQAIYQVRCNLFHGGKTFLSGGDREFVRLATAVLWDVWKESGAFPEGLSPSPPGAL